MPLLLERRKFLGTTILGVAATSSGLVTASTLAPETEKKLDSKLSSSSIAQIKTGNQIGLIGDGRYHALSEKYSSLQDAQNAFPFINSLQQSIDWAILQSELDKAKNQPTVIDLQDLQIVLSEPLVWKGGAYLKGAQGQCKITLMDNANCSVIESDSFDNWKEWKGGADNNYTLDGGIDGIIIDGNAQNQKIFPSSEKDLTYGLKIHSHRFQIGWLQIHNINGVGIRLAFNKSLVNSFRNTQDSSAPLQGSPLSLAAPYDIKNINISDTLYESFVFEGPADIPIWNLSTNYCGWTSRAAPPPPNRKSLLFPGEEIHSVRIQSPCKISYANLNGAIYGRSLYVAKNTRFHADCIITSSSWGGALIEGSAYGSISSLLLQQNSFSHNNQTLPYLEIRFDAQAGRSKSRISILHVSTRRTSNTPKGRGDFIYDDAGIFIGRIDCVDNRFIAGNGLRIGKNNIGGHYQSIDLRNVRSDDSTTGTAITIEAGSRDWQIDRVYLNNCDRGILNLGKNMRGTVLSGLIELRKSQIALEGVAKGSATDSVISNKNFIALDNIGSWAIEILSERKRFYNKARASASIKVSKSGQLDETTLEHNLWRIPTIKDIQISSYWKGAGYPVFNVGVKKISTNTISLTGAILSEEQGELLITAHLN
ncbi:hypothetical protein SOX05_20520 [Pseudomonas putida]|uniref:hypothetical protein n=1 Tax=unclassified Pseudomonas TaxID=196821 RepID=UPI002553AE01|nr:hypothetical protein [Pseudomonas sp. M2(2023)]MDY4312256.1 hypothetical protein [Pseudomonas putida]MDY4322542.1 hypothetical protein [Pseudomonas putida]MDY4355932.1 hypothetical protein [Pseudomonas putida]WIV25318.1 hypothetical protein QN085_06840 [Pseudomonas sp. M2(2023)]